MTNQGPSTVNPVTDAIITKFEEKYVIPFVDEAFAKVTVILKDNENFVKKVIYKSNKYETKILVC